MPNFIQRLSRKILELSEIKSPEKGNQPDCQRHINRDIHAQPAAQLISIKTRNEPVE